MKVLYILPKKKFFCKGVTGSTQHATGFVNGLIANKYKVRIGIHSKHKNQDIIKDIEYISLWEIITNFNALPEKTIVIRYAPSKIFCIILICLLGKVGNKKVIIEVNSLFANRLSNIFLNRTLLSLERFFISYSNHIITVSPALKFMLSRPSNQVFFVPNGHNMKSKNISFNAQKLNFKRLVYLGTDQPYYSFDEISQACNTSRLDFSFFGRIKNKGKTKHVLKNHFKGEFNHEELDDILCPSEDLLILPYKKKTLAEIGFPVKLSEYLSMGCLIISTDTGILGPLLNRIEKSLVYRDGDIQSLIAAIQFAKSLSVKKSMRILEKYQELADSLQWQKLAPMVIDGRDYN